jgi:hypothetical protein
MKHLCCSKIFLLLFLSFALYGANYEKSAIAYFGKDISYPMVGVHDYIFVKPKNINIYRHGFSLYNKKIYATIKTTNGYQQEVRKVLRNGYKNIYFIVEDNENSFQSFLQTFHKRHPKIHLALTARDTLLNQVYPALSAIVYYNALHNDYETKRFHSAGIDLIDIETVQKSEVLAQHKLVEKIKKISMIPYVSDANFDLYGLSSKQAIKREIFTIIDEDKVDRILSSAHQYGAMPLEYMGYIQHIHNLTKELPDIDMFASRYTGVIVWLSTDTDDFNKLFTWLLEVRKKGIKIAFASNFGFVADGMLLSQFGIETSDGDAALSNKKRIKHRDKMIGFEVEPQINDSTLYLNPRHPVKSLLTYEDELHATSTPAAIMPWGGYAVFGSFLFELDDNNLWVINPFAFFKEALRLEDLPIPDVTTHNGKRLLFSHIDGDGIMNAYEGDPQKVSGDIIYSQILKRYHIPISVSVIGAEISPKGLYPKLSKRLMNIAREMYALDSVEPATHTFTHTFKWGKIKKNGDLDPQWRLKPKGYHYSLFYELEGQIRFINKKLIAPQNPIKAKSVFWSGDCSPRANALSLTYKYNILNINGGYTTISHTEPWVTLVAPFGIERDGYYQIYTGAENENVYTNDWLGPFWGFKKVVQTFKMTDKPRRLKPIDVYYHLYSGSKLASVNALKYIYDWVQKQDVMPIFTSEYIPKVMDFYEVSMAHIGSDYCIDGMKNLKTLRFEDNDVYLDFKKSKTLLGKKLFNKRTYIHLGEGQSHYIAFGKKAYKGIYLIDSNAEVTQHIQGKHSARYHFKGHVPLDISLHVRKDCKVKTQPQAFKVTSEDRTLSLKFKTAKEASVDVICK